MRYVMERASKVLTDADPARHEVLSASQDDSGSIVVIERHATGWYGAAQHNRGADRFFLDEITLLGLDIAWQQLALPLRGRPAQATLPSTHKD
jgi:hypothetical protein